MPELRLIHTSDFHDHLTPVIAARLRALKEEHRALLIDTGDAIRAPNVAFFPWRERAIGLMNEAGYDAMGLGNREYFFRQRGMAQKTGHANFPRLCANLRAKQGKLPGIEPWTVLRSAEGLRVGLFGLMPTMIEPGHWFERLSDMRFIPWQEAAREAVGALTGATDLLVALVHRPLADARLLLPAIDLILAGHCHGPPLPLERTPSGALVSWAGGASARLIGLHLPDKTVTMDEALALR